MANNINVEIKGLKQLEANFARYPTISRNYINLGLRASIFEIQKRTDDGGDGGLFQFRSSRSSRTGYLARSFSFGISYGDLYASIGPTAKYAPYVYYGTRRMAPNKYMDRIAKDAQPDINKHFQQANEQIIREIAKI